jgi:LAS superfamily LD-carboxypeptidase LdcB
MKTMRLICVAAIFAILFPCAANADTGLLWLVNRENPLCENFVPPNMVSFRGIELREEARDAFEEMLSAMESEGVFGLKLQSAYRSYSHQRKIFDKKIASILADTGDQTKAAALAATVVQPPGASEHQLGLALDVTLDGQLSQSFGETKAGIWLAENCHAFGFIVRYPQSKTDVTDIIYEPWHLRYVGIPHAQIMNETALTLEEYHLFLAEIHMYLVWAQDGYYLISHANSPPKTPPENVTFSATAPCETAPFIVTTLTPQSFQELLW